MQINQQLINDFREFLLDDATYNIVEAQEFDDNVLRQALAAAIQEITNIPPMIDLKNYWDQLSYLVFQYAWIKLVQIIGRLYARNSAIPPGSGIPTIESTRLQYYQSLASTYYPSIRSDIEQFKIAKNAESGFGYADWSEE